MFYIHQSCYIKLELASPCEYDQGESFVNIRNCKKALVNYSETMSIIGKSG